MLNLLLKRKEGVLKGEKIKKISNIHINNIKANQNPSINLKAYSLSCLLKIIITLDKCVT